MRMVSNSNLAKALGISSSRGRQAVMKAQLISAILKAAQAKKLTHEQIAQRSGLTRSAVTGILSGSLQKVTLDRVLRMVEAVGLVAEVRIKRAA